MKINGNYKMQSVFLKQQFMCSKKDLIDFVTKFKK